MDLRDLIDRPRPTEDLVGVIIGYGGIQGDSFPSGHALHTMLFYGFLVYLSRDLMKPGPSRTAVWLAVALYVPVAGLWLVYDGRHWTSDVLGGYAYGAFYLLITILSYRWYLSWSERLIHLSARTRNRMFSKLVRRVVWAITEKPDVTAKSS